RRPILSSVSLFFSAPPPTLLYSLSLHDALPISLVLPGQHIEVVFCDTPRRPVLIHPGKQGIDLGFPLLRFFQFSSLFARMNEDRSEEHTSELQSRFDLVCRLLLEKKNTMI